MTLTEKELRKQIEQLQAKAAAGEADELLAKATQIKSTTVISAALKIDASGVKRLRDMAETLKQKQPDSVIILGMNDAENGKVSLLVAVGPKAPKTVSAADVLKEIAPIIDGRGGGKADMAQAGGTKAATLPDALRHGVEVASKKI